jgi:hypothetical protein
MSYQPAPPLSLGATAVVSPPILPSGGSLMDQIAGYINKAASVGGTVKDILDDPYLPEIACYVEQLHAINNNLPLPVCQQLPPGLPGQGVGLQKIRPFVRGYVYAEQHPWMKPVALAALFGVPFLVGYLVGRR